MRKIPLMTVLTGGVLVLLFLSYMVMFQVRFNEVAVRVTLGKADEHSIERDPGLKLRWPWPIEEVRKYDTRLRVLDTPEVEIKTRDQKNVIVGLYALWRIADPLEFSIKLVNEPTAEQQLRSRLNDVRAAIIGRYDMSAFVGLDEAVVNKNYDDIELALRNESAPDIRRDYGIELVSVGIRRISLPEQVTQAVFNSQTAERNTVAARYRGEGESQAAAIRARADSASKQIAQFVETKAESIASAGFEAQGRILQQIKEEDRDFFIWLRAMDALRTGLKEKSTIFFDSATQLVRLIMTPPTEGRLPKLSSDPALAPTAAQPAADSKTAESTTGGNK